MKNIKYNFLKVILSIIILFSINSCDEGGEPDPGKTTTGQYAGDWYIDLKNKTGGAVASHILHGLYNAESNDNTMIIDDKKAGYNLKCKLNIDTTTGFFSATNSSNDYEDLNDNSTVTITEGQIIKGGGTSKSGKTVDKIRFKAQFSYDAPGDFIIFEGHKRTGFLEDEY